MSSATLERREVKTEFYHQCQIDPVFFVKAFWPDVYLYKEQREILYSLRDNDETFVPAANMLGKDFITALGILWFFGTRHQVRIVTTSAKEDHLRVLWGEINNFVQTAKLPLRADKGGNLVCKHLEINKIVNGEIDKKSYIKGMVAGADSMAAMQGHHIPWGANRFPHTLFALDECSSVQEEYFRLGRTWSHRLIAIGNTWQCENSFRYSVDGNPATGDKGGNILRDNGIGYDRYVIPITAEMSPNVRYGLAQKARGLIPTDEILVPGVKTYSEYVKNRKLWDVIQQCVCLDAKFYRGPEQDLYPTLWLNRAATIASGLSGARKGVAIGIDSAMGGDNTAYAVVDDYGLIDLISMKTKDTNKIVPQVLSLMNQYGVSAENVLFDAGGGGYVHADRMREQGKSVRTIAFGESATPELKRRTVTPLGDRVEAKEIKYIYKNRRAEMYGELRGLLDPTLNDKGFGLPARYHELRRQLAPLPLKWDGEGRMYLPPKNRTNKESKESTLTELIGCSPDEADALVLAVFGLVNRKKPVTAGKAF